MTRIQQALALIFGFLVVAGVVVLFKMAYESRGIGRERVAPNEEPWAATLRVPPGFLAVGTVPEPYTKSGWAKQIVHEKTGIEMVFIPAGEFMMGSPESEEGSYSNEGPQRRVRIAEPFYMGKYEATQAQWQRVMGYNPSNIPQSDRLPVGRVTWYDCQEFVRKAGDGFRLPTEAEWEYACRAGSTGKYCFGNDDARLGEYAWYGANSGDTEHPVGEKRPNVFGLYDMHGNVWEWCQSAYKSYPYNAHDGREDVSAGDERVLRGGCWLYGPSGVRSANRSGLAPTPRYGAHGLRVCVFVHE